MALEYSVIDHEQLRRIESTHRGFLYQHLFAVGCMLIAQRHEVSAISVERDEDLELTVSDSRLYVQVKKRARQLNYSDIASSIAAFARIRSLHASGERNETAVLCIVSNVPPGTTLRQKYDSNELPSDVRLVWPNGGHSFHFLPPAWKSIIEGFDWCVQEADRIPYGSISGNILVWKLAAIVQFASAGETPYGHTFSVETFEQLFEQVIMQLQSFPEAPKPYISLEGEPAYSSSQSARIISGHSGSGKTSWASEASSHIDLFTAYYNVIDTPSAALPSVLTRELTAQLFPESSEERRQVILPGYSGLDSLRALDAVLDDEGRNVVVALDNVHRVAPDGIKTLVTATKRIQWLLLSQHHPNESTLASLLNISPEVLQGWTTQTIAAQCRVRGCPVDVATAEDVKSITNGLPLLVQSVVSLAKAKYEGDVELCCSEMKDAIHTSPSPQEAILGHVVNALSDTARKCLGIMSLVETPFSSEETRVLLSKSLAVSETMAARTMRELISWGATKAFRTGHISLHDVMQVFAAEECSALEDNVVLSARKEIKEILLESLSASHDLNRQVALLRILPLVGDTEELIEIATNEAERLKELGLSEELSRILTDFANDTSNSLSDRFWAIDTLALWSYDRDDLAGSERLTNEMEALFDEGTLGVRERCALATKRLLLLGRKGMIDEAFSELAEVAELVEEPQHFRIIKYDFGVGLFHAGQSEVAAKVAEDVVEEYFDALGLSMDKILFKNPPEIFRSLGKDESKLYELKRLADSLDLLSQSRERLGLPSSMQRMHAFKFYVMSGAFRSAVRVGQDVVHEFIANVGRPDEARRFIEDKLLPMVAKMRLLEHLLPVHSQYAVVLAYCGESAAAREEMRQLQEFEPRFPAERQKLLEQAQLIEDIIGGDNPFRQLPRKHNKERLVTDATLHEVRTDRVSRSTNKKVGRNASCPCGSGKKYKKCCLRKK